ncbi:hypothetical protein JCM3770_006675 [Rhodotorula araucariae]
MDAEGRAVEALLLGDSSLRHRRAHYAIDADPPPDDPHFSSCGGTSLATPADTLNGTPLTHTAHPNALLTPSQGGVLSSPAGPEVILPAPGDMRVCRICLGEGDDDDQGRLLAPCSCRGTARYVHQCGTRYRFRRTRLTGILGTHRAVSILALVFMVLLALVGGFVADPLMHLADQDALVPATNRLQPHIFDEHLAAGDGIREAVSTLGYLLGDCTWASPRERVAREVILSSYVDEEDGEVVEISRLSVERAETTKCAARWGQEKDDDVTAGAALQPALRLAKGLAATSWVYMSWSRVLRQWILIAITVRVLRPSIGNRLPFNAFTDMRLVTGAFFADGGKALRLTIKQLRRRGQILHWWQLILNLLLSLFFLFYLWCRCHTGTMAALLRRISSTTSDRPPSYTTTGDPSPPPPVEPPPPFTAFPKTYRIGVYNVEPLVDMGNLKQHLSLLGAFFKLRERVEGMDQSGCAAHLEPKARWAVFVQVAVYRFELIVAAYEGTAAVEPPLLPLDVALILHAYMLNPMRYDEDGVRVFRRAFRSLNGDVLKNVAKSIDPSTLTQRRPSMTEETLWAGHVNLEFDPLRCFSTTKGRHLLGFNGFKELEQVFVPWVTADGTGYAQQGFAADGPHGLALTHEVLGVARFVADVTKASCDPSAFLAGTITSSTSAPEKGAHSARAVWVRERVLTASIVQGAGTALELGRRLKWSHSSVRRMLVIALKGRERGANHIVGCYTRGEPFSLDLAMAVLRQGSFIDKMHGLGWTDPARFGLDDTLLKRCMARYHAFMDLMASSPSSFFVPTLDIDLAWHTHQLKSAYKQDTVILTARFIDHDDKVEEGALATAFDVTARAWKSRFGVPYSTCGCPLPSAPPLSRLVSKLGLGPTPAPAAAYPPDALAAADDADADATHASEHSALTLPHHPAAQQRRRARAAELDARRRRDDKVRRERQGASARPRSRERAAAHAYAFLAPVPLYPVYYGPAGYPIAAGGCATTSASQASPRNGSACGSGGGRYALSL